MKANAVVLLSGGQDSTTALFWAKREYGQVHALSIWYGQRHAAELSAAEAIADSAGVPWTNYTLPVGVLGVGSALVVQGGGLANTPHLAASGGLPDAEMPHGLPTSFVPGRNMVFLALAASMAAGMGARRVVTGVCQTDYSGYPDCREVFIQAMAEAASLAMPSSMRPMEIVTPMMGLTKAQTVELAMELPGCMEALSLSVTCYHGKRPGCGTCPACLLRAAGFREAGVPDPAEGDVL